MKIEQILEEYDRVGIIEEDKELCEFYYHQLNEYDISTPDELEDISEFFQNLGDEWMEELDISDMVTIYKSVCEEYEDSDKINLHFLHQFISEKIKKVVRGGKIIKKKVCKDGFILKSGKCVKQSKSDRKKKSKSAKRGAKKKKGKKASIARKTKKSMKKRKNF